MYSFHSFCCAFWTMYLPCMYLFVFHLCLLNYANKTITKLGAEWHWRDNYRGRMVVLLFFSQKGLDPFKPSERSCAWLGAQPLWLLIKTERISHSHCLRSSHGLSHRRRRTKQPAGHGRGLDVPIPAEDSMLYKSFHQGGCLLQKPIAFGTWQ